jgi:hypothetical protein
MIDSDIHEILFQLLGDPPPKPFKSSKSTLYRFPGADVSLVKVTRGVLDCQFYYYSAVSDSGAGVLQVRNKQKTPKSGRCKFADQILIMSR